MNHRAHVVIPFELMNQIDRLVGKRGRSSFMVDAASRELKRLRQLKALQAAAGSWKDKNHPELKSGAVSYVNTLRQQNEKEFQKRRSH